MGMRPPRYRLLSTRTPGPLGSASVAMSPSDGPKLLNGSSAAIRHPIPWPAHSLVILLQVEKAESKGRLGLAPGRPQALSQAPAPAAYPHPLAAAASRSINQNGIADTSTTPASPSASSSEMSVPGTVGTPAS